METVQNKNMSVHQVR